MEGISQPVLRRSQDRLSHNYHKLCYIMKHHVAEAKPIHCCFLKLGMISSIYICNSLIHLYSAELMIKDGRKMFDEMSHKNEYSWFMMISGYTQLGRLRDTVSLFNNIHDDDEGKSCGLPNEFVFGDVFKGCVSARALGIGVQFHCSAIKHGFADGAFIRSSLVNMYGTCGDVGKAWSAFKHCQDRNDVVSWTAMITCLSNHEKQEFRESGFELFGKMISNGVLPSEMTFTSLFKVFDEPTKLDQARQVHGCMVKFGIKVDDLLASALISAYGSCGGLNEAVTVSCRVTRMDTVSWTSLLNVHVKNGFNMEAVNIFYNMLEAKSKIDPFVVTSVLRACGTLEALGIGQEIHAYSFRNNLLSDISVGNALISLYGRCKEIRKAESAFGLMEKRDDVSWTALLSSYVKNDNPEEALLLFLQMLREVPDQSILSITCVVSAVSLLASHFLGEQMHSIVIRLGINIDLSVQNSLVTMYGKCGDVLAALRTFMSVTKKDLVSWNAMIAVFSQHGFEKEALNLFYDMQKEGIDPDDYTFLGVLVSCSRAGRVDEACEYFNSMKLVYGIYPKSEHYASMVDLYGRSGRLRDAIKFINSMPCSPGLLVWEALLASCMFHGNLDIGEMAVGKIQQISPGNPSAFTIIANLHASKGMWDLKARTLSGMKSRGIKKHPSRAWVEIMGYTHVFFTDENSHFLIPFIHQKLDELKIRMVDAGYVPDTSNVFHDIEHNQKEISLLHHSEKLALVFALFTTVRESPIRIMQNLRCCGDCHAAFKIISLIENRYIILRDRNRFHHFRRGSCSCKDYW